MLRYVEDDNDDVELCHGDIFERHKLRDQPLSEAERAHHLLEMQKLIGNEALKVMRKRGEENGYDDNFCHTLSYTPAVVFTIFDRMMLFLTEISPEDDDLAFGLLFRHVESSGGDNYGAKLDEPIGQFSLSELHSIYPTMKPVDHLGKHPLATYWLARLQNCSIEYLG